MAQNNLILIEEICIHYDVNVSFLNEIIEIGLVKIEVSESKRYIHVDEIGNLEKIIRIHSELNVNVEGIDVVFNLLNKIESLQNELAQTKNRLNLFDND